MTTTTSPSSTKVGWDDIYIRLGEAAPATRRRVEAMIDRLVPHRRRAVARARLLRLPPEYKELRGACRWDVELFAREFFPHLCHDAFSTMHHDFFEDYKARADQRGWREVTAAPRGNAKTTIKAMIKIAHDCVYSHEDYTLVISSRHEMARDKVKDIRDELESNERLNLVYGPQVGPLWNLDDFITARGSRVRAASPRSQVRGLLWHGFRPTKVLLDDAESSEAVLTEMQRDKFYHWLMNDISRIGTQRTIFEIIGTVLHPQSLISILMATPGWTHRKYKAVIKFADAVPLWQEWREIFIDLMNEDAEKDADAFFEAHMDEMLAGSEVLWEDHEPYYQLMKERVIFGETSFWQEKQNEPLGDARFPFRMDQAGYCRIFPDILVRSDGYEVPLARLTDWCAFWDPNLGEGDNPDWGACVVVACDDRGYTYVLDAYMQQFEPPSSQVVGIAEMLSRWKVPRVGLETNNFQSLLTDNLRQAIAVEQQQFDWPITILPVRNTKAKHMRILGMEPLIANRWMWFSDRLPQQFYQQFAEYRPLPDAGKDDAPDATESAIRVLRGQYDRHGNY